MFSYIHGVSLSLISQFSTGYEVWFPLFKVAVQVKRREFEIAENEYKRGLKLWSQITRIHVKKGKRCVNDATREGCSKLTDDIEFS